MAAASTALVAENGVEASKVTFGVASESFATSVMPLVCRDAAEKAVTAIGTFWIFSSVLCAVTIIVSTSPCARAASATANEPRTKAAGMTVLKSRARANSWLDFTFQPPLPAGRAARSC
jgi:hypothetical protein